MFSKWQGPCRIAACVMPADAGTTYSGMFERMPRKRGLPRHRHAAFAKASAGPPPQPRQGLLTAEVRLGTKAVGVDGSSGRPRSGIDPAIPRSRPCWDT